MSKPIFTIDYTTPRSRLTTLFRAFLHIPHYVIEYLWRALAQALAIFQWFVILFTGRRSRGIWSMQRAYLGYAARTNAYFGVMYDKWPNIGPEPDGEPTHFSFEFESSANRLTNVFRIIWILPTVIIALFVMILAAVCLVFSWLSIVVFARQPRVLFNYLAKTHAFMTHLSACTLLMSDVRPKFRS